MTDRETTDTAYEQVPYADIIQKDRYLTSFYSNARLYSIVAKHNYAFRQVWFVLNCCEDFGRWPVRSGLELCCGPALHAINLAEEGVSMIGMDNSPEMLEIARENAAERNADLRLVRGNMITYRTSPPVDFAINLGLNTSYILSNEEMIEHLHAVADSLNPGGLYIVDMEFLVYRVATKVIRHEPPWIVYETQPSFVARAPHDGLMITIQFGDTTSYYDPIRQLFRGKDFIRLERGTESQVIETEAVGKVYFPLEFRALIAQTGRFDFIEWYDEYYMSSKFGGDPDVAGYIVVMQRR